MRHFGRCGGSALGRVVVVLFVAGGIAAAVGSSGSGWGQIVRQRLRELVDTGLGKVGIQPGPVAALTAIDKLGVNSAADLPKLEPFCTARGYRVMGLVLALSDADGTPELGDYELVREDGDLADVRYKTSSGRDPVIRMVREGGQWKVDDARGADGVWISTTLALFGR